MISGPSQEARIHSRSAIVMVGSNSLSSRSATVPDQEDRDANVSGSVVSRFSHQAGWVAASTTVLTVSAGGMEKPLRASRSRAPATGTSTVSMSASYPAALARAMRSSPAERSFHTYSWNHLRASGPAAATSSMEVVPIVDRA